MDNEKEKILVTKNDLIRIRVVERYLEKKMAQHQAAKELDLSERQFRRYVRRYEVEGIAGLVNKARGGANNKISIEHKKKILEILKEKYCNIGPTQCCQKLVENDEIQISPGTVRNWMIAEGMWMPKTKKQKSVQLSTKRT